MKAYRILITHHCGRISGAERSLLDLLSEFRKRGSSRYEFFAASPEDGVLQNLLGNLNIVTYSASFFRMKRRYSLFNLLYNLFKIIIVTFQLLVIVRNKKIDLIHANSTSACIESFLASKIARIPIIWHVRDNIKSSFIEKFLERNVNFIIAISNFAAQKISRSERLKVIFNGVAVSNRANGIKVLHEKDFSNSIITISQLVPWKRHDLILEAIALLKMKYANLKLIIIGEDLFNEHSEYIHTLKLKIQKAGLTRQIEFSGYQNNIQNYISNSLLVVHPAENEPLGRVVVESMLIGKVVIAANSGGIPEYVQHGVNGYLFESGSAKSLAETIDFVLSQKNHKKIRSNARKTAIKLFSPAVQAGKIIEVYDEVVCRRQDREREWFDSA